MIHENLHEALQGRYLILTAGLVSAILPDVRGWWLLTRASDDRSYSSPW